MQSRRRSGSDASGNRSNCAPESGAATLMIVSGRETERGRGAAVRFYWLPIHWCDASDSAYLHMLPKPAFPRRCRGIKDVHQVPDLTNQSCWADERRAPLRDGLKEAFSPQDSYYLP
uniref:Uncharacterized protein n=1 Tax=Odontella aurita TaxID=265563 RepID=A0A7S4IBQ6_9STRA